MKWIGSFLIRILASYRLLISPLKNILFGPAARCRFSPTCSQYAIDAIQHHGSIKGLVLTGKRLCRCHPWGGWGWDPVPSHFSLRPLRARSQSDPSPLADEITS